MQMDYFRRPQLAGNNIARPLFPYVRGSVRRADADGVVAFPYFPGAAATQTINVKLDGVVYPVTLTGNGITTVIADINAAVGVNGVATDADGTLSIQSSTSGANGSAEVTGGTAAAALGFDVSLGRIRSVGGDIQSSPEGRVGNWFGVALPNKGENFTVESMNRALSRLSANSDVLFSEHVRADALPKKISYTTSDGKTLTPTSPDSVRVFTGLGLLTGSTPKESLAPFFFFVDTVTGLPPASRVVAIVRGTPAGLPPYADATTWVGGGSTGNVLGVDLEKVSSAITNIKNGRVLVCSGADFVTAKVVAGDFVSISGATNLNPWSNNGYRWVVEEVISATTIAVRPMSSSELAQVGTVSTEEQPLVELNGKKTGIEIYGTVSVKTGTYSNDVRVIADPPIPAGATYDLYVAVPGDLRSKKTYEPQAKDVSNRFVASDLRPSPNVLLSSPTITSWSAASVILTGGLARFSDRVVSIPARTIPASDFSNLSVNYVYWDKDANDIKVTRSHVKVVNSDPTLSPGSGFPADIQATQHIIAQVFKSGANITSVLFEGRVVAEHAANRVITVGVDGQFTKLEDAVHFINRWYRGNGQRSDTYPQFEIVITSNTTLDYSTIVNDGVEYGALPAIFLDCPVKIRGAHPNVQLIFKNYTSYVPFDLGWSGGGTYIMEDLSLVFADASFAAAGLFFTRSGASLILKNVTMPTIYDFASIVQASGPLVVMDGCFFRGMKSSIVSFGNTATSFEIFNSKFEMNVTPATAPSLFGSSFPAVFACNRLVVRDCEFTRLSTDQGFGGTPLMGWFGHYTLFDGCLFSRFGSNPVALDSVLFRNTYTSGPLIITNCKSGYVPPTRVFIDSQEEANCVVQNCHLWVEPDAGSPGIRAPVVVGNYINCIGGSSQVLVEATRLVDGNYITGLSSIAIKNSATTTHKSVQISNNRIEVSGGTSIQIASYGGGWQDNTVSVTGNQIKVAGTGAIGIKTYDGTDIVSVGNVSDNHIRIRTGDGISNKIGIDVKGNPIVSSNVVTQVFGETVFTTGHIGIKVTSFSGYSPHIIGNTSVFGAGAYTSLNLDGSGMFCQVVGNYFASNGTGVSFTTPGTPTASVFSQNYIQGTSTAILNFAPTKFYENYVSGPVTSPVTGVTEEVSGNVFTSTVTLNGKITSGFRVEKNSFTGDSPVFGGLYVDLLENTFTFGVTYVSSGYIHGNSFNGGNATTIQGGNVQVEGNSFFGINSFLIYGYPAIVRGNRFIGGGSLTVGQNGFSTSTIFSDNWVQSPTDIQSDFDEYVEVERNYFSSNAILSEVDRLNGNFFGGGNVTVTGRVMGLSSSPVPAVGNVFIGGGTRSFTGFNFSGMRYYSSSGTTTFTDCQFDGCHFETPGTTVTFVRANISASRFETWSTITLNSVRMMGCFSPGSGAMTVSGGASGGVQVSGFRVGGSFTFTATGSNTDIMVADSRIDGALTVTGGSFDSDVSVTGCWMTGTLTITPSGGTSKVTVSGCYVEGTGTSTVSCGYSAFVHGCSFAGPLAMTGFGQIQTLSDCYIDGGVAFSNDPSGNPGLKFNITGNSITSGPTVHGLSFPTFAGNDNWQEINICNNIIDVAQGTAGGGNIVQASCIFFAGKGANAVITGNKLSIGNGSGDPGGVGAFTHAMIEMVGSSHGVVIIGNRLVLGPSIAGWTFRAAALTVAYKFVKILDFSQSGGAGNIMSESYGTTTAGAGRAAEVFYNTTSGSFTIP